MKLVFYDIAIISLVVAMGIAGILAAYSSTNIKEWYLLGFGTIVSFMLFVIPLRLDKSAGLRLFALSDPDRRAILEYLSEGNRTYDELEKAFPNVARLSENLEFLKKARLISEKEEDRGNSIVRRFQYEL
jgi:hypothetical protein